MTGPIGTAVLNGELDIDRAHGDLPSGSRTATPQREFVKVVKAVRVGGIEGRLFRGRSGSFSKSLRPNRVGGQKKDGKKCSLAAFSCRIRVANDGFSNRNDLVFDSIFFIYRSFKHTVQASVFYHLCRTGVEFFKNNRTKINRTLGLVFARKRPTGERVEISM